MDIIKFISDSRKDNPRVNLGEQAVFDENMKIVHSVIKASEDLLIEAAKLSSGKLKEYYLKHLEEEKDHSIWLMDDLCIEEELPSPVVTAMVGTQYYLMKFVDPCALLGYIACLECIPMDMDIVEYLESIHGEKKIRTLKYHSIHDIEHGSDVIEFIETLSPSEKTIVVDSIIRTESYLSALSYYLSGVGHG